MSRARHHEHKRARGGSTKPVWEAGGGTNAAKEAEEKTEGEHLKKGGRVHHGEGEHPKHRADKRKRGGKVEKMEVHETMKRAHGGEVHHEVKEKSMKHHHGMHVPGRKMGGGVGANRTPLSTAATIKKVVKGEENEGEPTSD